MRRRAAPSPTSSNFAARRVSGAPTSRLVRAAIRTKRGTNPLTVVTLAPVFHVGAGSTIVEVHHPRPAAESSKEKPRWTS